MADDFDVDAPGLLDGLERAAQLYLQPYRPGATYIARGRGCGKVFEDALEPNCQMLGPINATL